VDECGKDNMLFTITHTLARSLNDSEEYEPIMWVPGEITATYEDETSVLAGRTSLYIVDYARAKYECGLTLHDVLDGDLVTYSYAPALLGYDGDLNKVFEDMLVERILIIHRIEVLPKFRGRRLGIWALYRILDCFAPSSVLPVIMPYPLQFSPAADDPSSADLHLGGFNVSQSDAFRKIRDYWAQVGFEKAWSSGDEQLWFLDPTRRHPHRKDVLGEFYES
jgi:hypothetical protein